MTRLRSCDACARHVFVTETRCPFCSAELAQVTAPPIFDIKAGMSRAQRYTLVAAVATQTLIGCSDIPKTGNLGQGSGGASQQGSGGTAQGSGGTAQGGSGGGISVAGKGGGAQPVYGAPVDPPGTGGNQASGTGGQQGIGGAQAVYGAPVPVDAGVSDAGDAGDDQPKKDGGPMAQPVYGAPFPVYGSPLPSDQNK